jgi:hypothetical protein
MALVRPKVCALFCVFVFVFNLASCGKTDVRPDARLHNEDSIYAISYADELYNIMDKIEEQELQEVKKFIETEAGKEVEYAFGQLILNKEDTDSITKYITGRNKIIKKCLILTLI